MISGTIIWFARLFTLGLLMLCSLMLGAWFGGGIKSSGTSGVDSSREDIRSTKKTPETNDSNNKIDTESSGDSAASLKDRQTQKQLQMFLMAIAVCLLNTIVMMIVMVRARVWRFALMAYSFIVFFGCMTMMPQIDTLFFIRNPWPIIRMSLVMGVTMAGLFSIIGVPVVGRWKNSSGPVAKPVRLPGTMQSWSLRVLLIALVYVVIYYTFGYLVAWQNPELRQLYGGESTASGFFTHLVSGPVLTKVLPLQFARGILWALLVTLMVGVQKGGRLEVGLVVALCFAVLMNSQLLLPNPVMNESVRITHMIETATSNFLFGFLAVWILWQSPGSDSR